MDDHPAHDYVPDLLGGVFCEAFQGSHEHGGGVALGAEDNGQLDKAKEAEDGLVHSILRRWRVP